MNTNQLLSTDMLEILFDNRNKSYGAYELRRSYDSRVKKALLLTAALLSMVLLCRVFANSFKTDKAYVYHEGIILTEVPIEEPQPELIQPEKKPLVEQPRTEKFITMKIVDDDKVKEPPVEVSDLTNVKIGEIKSDGPDALNIATPADLGNGTGIVEQQVITDPPIWTKVEVDAAYDGDWAKFLNRNLNPQTPTDNSAPDGTYRVLIQFVVDIDGTISDLKPLTNMGYGMEQEAIRVIKKSMKWKPAFQNSRNVKAYRTQPVTFQVISE